MPQFSRQNYVAVASRLKQIRQGYRKPPLTETQMRMVYDTFEEMFMEDNTAFERREFYQAVYRD